MLCLCLQFRHDAGAVHVQCAQLAIIRSHRGRLCERGLMKDHDGIWTSSGFLQTLVGGCTAEWSATMMDLVFKPGGSIKRCGVSRRSPAVGMDKTTRPIISYTWNWWRV